MKGLFSFVCMVVAGTVMAADPPGVATDQSSGPVGSTGQTSEPSGGPRIQFKDTRKEFGMVPPQVLKATFEFKNAGDCPLEIQGVHPACGCTVATNYDKTVAAGQTGVIQAELNTTGYHGGRIEKGITVLSNDPKSPSVYLAMTAIIKLELNVLPQQNIFFAGLTPSTLTNKTLEITSEMKEPLVVTNIVSSLPYLTATISSNATNSTSIEIATRPPLPAGMHWGKVTVFTQYEKYRQIEIPASVQVAATIFAMPSRLIFHRTQPSVLDDISFLVMRKDGKQFHITSVNSDTPMLSSEIVTNHPGVEYKVIVKYTPSEGQSAAVGKLEVLTDEPNWPKVEVPVLFR